MVALFAPFPVNPGIDNMGSYSYLRRFVEGLSVGKPLALVPNGDLVSLMSCAFACRTPGSTGVSKVMAHANWDDVAAGRTTAHCMRGNDCADGQATSGLGLFGPEVTVARDWLHSRRVHWAGLSTLVQRLALELAEEAAALLFFCGEGPLRPASLGVVVGLRAALCGLSIATTSLWGSAW